MARGNLATLGRKQVKSTSSGQGTTQEVTMKSVRQLLQAKGRNVHTIAPDARVFDALKLMADKDVGALVVTEGDRLAGIISERDYARKVILLGKSSQDIPVRDIMTGKVITVGLDQTVEECMAIMTGKRIRHLPVTEGERLAGVLSIGDLVKEVIAEQEQTIRQLESYIHS
jgi:CBS domain-containing protein